MKPFFPLFLLLSASCVFLPLSAVEKMETMQGKEVRPLNGWTNQFRTARRNAKAAGRLVIVLFTISDSSNPSNRQMIQLFRTRNFIRKANEDYVLVHADLPKNQPQENELMDQNRRLQGRFHVTVFPSVILVDPVTPWGNLLYMRSGFLQPDEFLSDLEAKCGPRLKKLRSVRKKAASSGEK